jgi:hypothetical protein
LPRRYAPRNDGDAVAANSDVGRHCLQQWHLRSQRRLNLCETFVPFVLFVVKSAIMPAFYLFVRN